MRRNKNAKILKALRKTLMWISQNRELPRKWIPRILPTWENQRHAKIILNTSSVAKYFLWLSPLGWKFFRLKSGRFDYAKKKVFHRKWLSLLGCGMIAAKTSYNGTRGKAATRVSGRMEGRRGGGWERKRKGRREEMSLAYLAQPTIGIVN